MWVASQSLNFWPQSEVRSILWGSCGKPLDLEPLVISMSGLEITELVASEVKPVLLIRSFKQDYKESWAQKNWCFWTVVLEKTLESPLNCKEIQPAHPKGNQSWVFTGRTDDEVETPIFWPPDVKSWLIVKDPDAGKDWGQEEKGTTEDEMVGWHHRLNGHEFG